MQYRSTRSNYSVSDTRAVLEGLAPDGGLYINTEFSKLDFDYKKCLTLSSIDMAEYILSTLLPGFNNMHDLVQKAYVGKFETDDLTPLCKVNDNYVLELFHGPTSAFKDVALSMLPQLLTKAKEQEGQKEDITILTATSGDTGKAALEGFHDVPGVNIIVFYPDGGVSPIQKAQMVTQEGKNVKVCAVRGNFDDCQTAVKKVFSQGIKGKTLSSANSINIGRLAPQVTYYFIAYKKLLENDAIKMGDLVDFCVPTGNFGDILAGYYAKLLGLPVGTLICASNQNNILTDFINTGVYDTHRKFTLTVSPSMDILVSSNLERLLFLFSGNPEYIKGLMDNLKTNGKYKVSDEILGKIQAEFKSGYTSEDETLNTIKNIYTDCNYLMDTHTAVAYNVAEKLKGKNTMVVLSTASAYKFPYAVSKAIGKDIYSLKDQSIPKNLLDLDKKRVLHTDVIDKEDIIDYVTKN